MSTRIPIRDPEEIQRAHDILTAIMLKEVPCPKMDDAMHAALDVLCWVLKHEHNFAFHNNLKTIEQVFAEHGIVESKAFSD